jgi:putative Mn2+ efflux pump MntP
MSNGQRPFFIDYVTPPPPKVYNGAVSSMVLGCGALAIVFGMKVRLFNIFLALILLYPATLVMAGLGIAFGATAIRRRAKLAMAICGIIASFLALIGVLIWKGNWHA